MWGHFAGSLQTFLSSRTTRDVEDPDGRSRRHLDIQALLYCDFDEALELSNCDDAIACWSAEMMNQSWSC
ncbi:unnamed protein product [Leptidea sinapis]|uniref:Uncharacterized protein n=1 Tax=Leptidea sinapis TaxID=189913 RepID=A0A5E4QWY5_9NEOP|nr:unnamed protein product [Leptidea sinapis]